MADDYEERSETASKEAGGSLIDLPGQELEKAAAEVFKVLGNETGKGLAAFTGNAFGALLGDKVRDWRTRNMIQTAAKTKELFDKHGIPLSQTRTLPMGEFYALFEGASKEDDVNLSEMWSQLLATAMTSADGQFETKRYARTLEQMQPVDARLLDLIVSHQQSFERYQTDLVVAQEKSRQTDTTEDLMRLSEKIEGLREKLEHDYLSNIERLEMNDDNLKLALSSCLQLNVIRPYDRKDMFRSRDLQTNLRTYAVDLGRGSEQLLEAADTIEFLNGLNEKVNFLIAHRSDANHLMPLKFSGSHELSYELTELGQSLVDACGVSGTST